MQIPADLLSFNGDEKADGAARLQAVKGHVANMRAMIARSEQESLQQRVKEQVYEHPETVRPQVVSHAFEVYEESEGLTPDSDTGSFALSSDRGLHAKAAMQTRAVPRSMSFSRSVPGPVYDSQPVPMSFGSKASGNTAAAASSSSGEPASDAGTRRETAAKVPMGKPDTRRTTEVPKQRAAPGVTQDLTQVPAQLDAAFLEHDTRAALRPTTLTPASEGWVHRSYPSLLSKSANVQSWSQAGGELQHAKSAAFDLLDALSRSGALPLRHAALHVVVAATHHFDSTLVDTVVQRNINPIEAVERSLLIIARSIHGKPVAQLVGEDQLPRIAGHSTDLLLEEGATAA
jgi:hypothetical protein